MSGIARLVLLAQLAPGAGAEPRRADAESEASIDSILAAVWVVEGVEPAPRCTDDEFLRRISLDLLDGSRP